MNQRWMAASLMAAVGMVAMAQSAVDAYQLSQSDLRGTARFMSMAGAFGALGGDLSTLVQNPAGVGVYRSSEIGATLDIDFQSTKVGPTSNTQTKAYCNNFGYVGAVNLNSEAMPYFQWGATYNRAACFDRRYAGSTVAGGSLTNFVADYTNNWGGSGWSASELQQSNYYNPYQESFAPWMSVLMYNNFLINQANNTGPFLGLYGNGTLGEATFNVLEKGYVDEYSINFGGNVMDIVYWGIGFGITDISYTSEVYYSENLDNAVIPSRNSLNEVDGVERGWGKYGLSSWKHVGGTGFNFKAGVIVKPINELRFGLAVHTPTYYSLTQEGWAGTEYDFESDVYSYNFLEPESETDYGYNDWFDYKLQTPWRLIASAAAVLDGRFIVSADYEYRAYHDMKLRDPDDYTFDLINDDVQATYQSTNTLRLGAEARLSPQVSLRAGYCYESSPAKQEAMDGQLYVDTMGAYETGTTPSFSLDKSTQYITCGIGYRNKWFSADAAYVHRYRQSRFYGYSPVGAFSATDTGAPMAEVTDHNNQIVLSVGFHF